MISEAVIQEVLHLDDAEGVDCLSNGEIFTGLAQMGYEKPSIKLTFYKAFFSRVKTPLFKGMLAVREIVEEGIAEAQVQDNTAAAVDQEDVAKDVYDEVIPSLTSPTSPPPPSHDIPSTSKDVVNQGRMISELDKDEGIELVDEQVKDIAEVKGRQTDKQAEIYQLDLDHPSKDLSMQEDDSEVQEVVEVVTTAKLITEVVTAATSQVSAASATIPATKPSISVAALTVVAAYTRRRKGVIIRDPKEELSSKTPAETPTDAKSKDKGKGIMIEKPKPIKKKDQIELDAEYARKLHEEINKDIDWDTAIDHNNAGYKLDYFKGLSYDDIRPIFQAKFDANMRFLLKTKEQMEEEDRRALKSINETPAQKAAKRRKLNEEAKKVKDLKKHLEIVPDEDDDVYTEATPLTRKAMFERPDGQDAVWKSQRSVQGMDVCHALADLGASNNLMPLSIWKKLSLPELTPTRMTLELADRSITSPKGVTEDVFVKLGKFHFPTDFVVVDFEADPRVPPILGRSFLRTGRALIDVYGEEITLRVSEESVTFNLNQTMRYSLTYDDNFVNRVDVIDIACKEFVQDILDFQYNPKSSNPTFVSDPLIPENDFSKEPIVKSSSPTLTPFGESDFFLEEIKDFLNDDLIPTGIENYVYDPKGDILFHEKLLNEDPFQLPLMDLKLAKETKKISDIKGVDPRFFTHKILMEDDYKLAVQSQRRVNPKIHDVIKKKVIKLLVADMIYPISNSPWVSKIHCVPKKGGNVFYCFLDGFSRYFQIPIDPQDQEKTTFTCPYGTSRTVACPLACVMLSVDRAKVDVITKLPHPTTVKGVKSFLGHAGFYRRFIQDFSKIARPMTHLLEMESPFVFYKECIDAFNTLKKKLTEAPILIIQRCVHGQEAFEILKACHEGPTGGYHGANLIVKKTSGQVKVSNHGLKRILKRTVRENDASWSDKLDDALWAFCTAYKTSIGCTPYKLVYGKPCHLPIELEHRAYWALKHVNIDLKITGDHRKLQLNKLRKLKTCWAGPFTITQVFPYGTIELSQPNGPNFKWEHPPLVVGTYTASGNSLMTVGMPCAFYSQQSSPKLDSPSALKFSRIK
uniref:Reverse transcriptase domain-containing protein n=1 Tax=Tanacetum cinerariifolium TaxID=118510 RepID=A0A6L2LD71_TANCI|nr:hypothetical protein [Tanacetum cinerariifolium]